jgi:hypothetical protein
VEVAKKATVGMKRTTKVSLGLFAAWALHDLEELITFPRESRKLARRAPQWLPIPSDIRQDGLCQRHVTTSIGIVGAAMGVAALAGVRSQGRSRFFQTMVEGFGWHGVGHLAGTLLTRQYTSGVTTTPILVLPYWLWARRELSRAGVPRRALGPRYLIAAYPLLLGVHVATRAVLRGAAPAGDALHRHETASQEICHAG